MKVQFCSTVALAAVLSLLAAGSAYADEPEVSSPIEEASNSSLVTDILAESLDVAIDTSAETAIEASVDGVDIAIPSDPAAPITLAAEGAAPIEITVPSADSAASAQSVDGSTVAYDNGDGSSTVPVVKENGSLQLLTVLADSTAPQQFAYDLASGAGVSTQALADGGFLILDAAGEEIASAAAPWATDAAGQSIPTHYVLEGARVTQVLDTSAVASVEFPVVADPIVTVTSYQYKYVNVVKTNNWTNKKIQLGICKITGGGGGGKCTISNSYEVYTQVDVSFGLTANTVGANIGISAGSKISGSVQWTSPAAPAGYSYMAWAVGTKATYQIQKWKVVNWPGHKVSTLVSTSGTLVAFSPVKGAAYGRY